MPPRPRPWTAPGSRRRAAGPSPPCATWPRTPRETRTPLDTRWPLVVKCRTSSRRDLVRLVPGRAELDELLPEWGDEPVVAQEFAANDGFDIKVWVIGEDLSAARRRSALESVDKSSDEHLDPADLPEDWIRAARDAGAALGLQLYGVDLLITGGPAAWSWTSIPSPVSAAPAGRRSHCCASSRRSWPRGR